MDMQERYPMEIFKQNWCFEANLNFLIQMLCGESQRNSNTEISRERRLSGVGTGNASSLHLHNTQTFTSANTLSYFPSAYTKIPLRSWLLSKNILKKQHLGFTWFCKGRNPPPNIRSDLDSIICLHPTQTSVCRNPWIILFTSHVTHFVVGVTLLK